MALIACLTSVEIPCEKTGNNQWPIQTGVKRTCFMNKRTAISHYDTTIASAKDDCIEGLFFSKNKKINYLPLSVYKIFPNLVVYDAGECSVKAVSKKHLKGLAKLEKIWISSNLLQTLTGDVFDDLVSLKWLHLSEKTNIFVICRNLCLILLILTDNNNIKYISPETFLHLTQLEEVWLDSNQCVDENFFDEYSLSTMSKVITDNCGISKSVTTLSTSSSTDCSKFIMNL